MARLGFVRRIQLLDCFDRMNHAVLRNRAASIKRARYRDLGGQSACVEPTGGAAGATFKMDMVRAEWHARSIAP